jgi:hypothetical protein
VFCCEMAAKQGLGVFTLSHFEEMRFLFI